MHNFIIGDREIKKTKSLTDRVCGNNLKSMSRVGNGLVILDTKIIKLFFYKATNNFVQTSNVFCGNSGQNTRSVTKAYKLHDFKQLACAEDKKYGSVK